MRSIEKNKSLPYVGLLFAYLLLSLGCLPSNNSKKNTPNDKPIQRKIKNGAHYAEDVNSGKIRHDDFIGSPVRTASATVAGCHIQIRYSSPGVRGRKIWGNIVPYNKLWVTGANHATAITFDHDVQIENRTLRAGTYAFFTIPSEKNWVIIFNTNADQHGTDDYNKKEDIFRFLITPVVTPAVTQRLTYKITQRNNNSALISMSWEKRDISFVLTIPGKSMR